MKKWFVHRNNETHGPWTAEEIRAALRMGVVDPFDMVNVENSSVLRELVEIDEIFQGSGTSPAAAAPPAAAHAIAEPAATIMTAPQDEQAGGGMLALAEPNIENRVSEQTGASRKRFRDSKLLTLFKVKKKKGLAPSQPLDGNLLYEQRRRLDSQGAGIKDLKRYYLIDRKGRILGPKSAGEIQRLYYQGVLTRDVKVKKSESEHGVSIAKFMDVYAQAKGGMRGCPGPAMGYQSGVTAPRMPTSTRTGLFGRTAVTGFRMMKTSRYLTIASIACLILSIIIGVNAYQSLQKSKSGSRTLRSKVSGSNRPGVSKKKRKPPKVKSKSKKKSKKFKKSKSKSRKGRNGGTLSRPPGYKKGSYKFRKTTSASKGNRKLAAKRTKNGNALRSVGAARRWNGKVVTVGPLSFRPTDLNKCTLKCEIAMKDEKGGRITVKFFKAAFTEKLVGRSVKIFITGRLSDGGKVMFLQDTR